MKLELRKLLADGGTAKVINKLRSISPFLKKDLEDEILLLSSRFRTFLKAKNRGQLSSEQQEIQLAKINDALLVTINELPEGLVSPITSKRKTLKLIGVLVALITFLAAVAEFSGYSLRDIFDKKQENTNAPNKDLFKVKQNLDATKKLDKSNEAIPLKKNNALNLENSSINQETSGDQSSVVIGNDVNINYGEPSKTTEKEKLGAQHKNEINLKFDSIQQKTIGKQSPAVIGSDVKINYSNWTIEDTIALKDTVKN